MFDGSVLKLRKLDSRGLKDLLDVKEANFWGLIAKICYLRPILTSRTHIWPIFMYYTMGIEAYFDI